uniref:Uncharacterized protein n=1 Tax=Siphoviridae sp. cttnq1 TaxID=2826495 RepID=A0A8S5QYM0_9CAUD|nr:MAG TPA: hypothetical protein [Siphoviridae sp. cttnq1]DAF14289.1 MAG TPA: hypothetical protein [Caudoviricetes sp.]
MHTEAFFTIFLGSFVLFAKDDQRSFQLIITHGFTSFLLTL